MLQLGDSTAPITDYSGKLNTVSAFLEDYFQYDYSFRWPAVAIVAFLVALFRMGSVFAPMYLNYQRR